MNGRDGARAADSGGDPDHPGLPQPPSGRPQAPRPPAQVVDLNQRKAAADDRLAAELRQLVGPGLDDDPPDTEALLGRLGAALPQPSMVVRAIIVGLSALQLVMVLPWLVDADPFGLLGQSTPAHLTRDGSLGLAVAVSGLLASWRPRWSIPCFAIASIALVAQTAAGMFDRSLAGGTELVHLPSVVLTCLIGLSSVKLQALGPNRLR